VSSPDVSAIRGVSLPWWCESSGAERSAVALVAAFLTGVYFVSHVATADALVAVGLIWVLVVLAAVDIKTRIIPNAIVVPAWVVALLANIGLHPENSMQWIGWSFGASIAFLAFARISHGGMGMGDVKLVGFVGAVLGERVFGALLIGTSLGALVAAAILIRGGREARSRTIAYGPFIAAGVLAILLFWS